MNMLSAFVIVFNFLILVFNTKNALSIISHGRPVHFYVGGGILLLDFFMLYNIYIHAEGLFKCF